MFNTFIESYPVVDISSLAHEPDSFSVGESGIGELVVNVAPSATGNNPCEEVVGKGDEGVVDEVVDESSVVGNLRVGVSGSGILLVEPLEEGLDGKLESPGGGP